MKSTSANSSFGEYERIVAEYRAGLSELADQVASALQTQNLEALRRVAHRLRGSAAAFQLVDLSVSAGWVEDAIRDARPVVELAGLADRLASVCRDLAREAS